MLSYYAHRFSTVEINNSFYRVPSQDVVESWIPQILNPFRFAIKAPQTTTHRRRLKNADLETERLLRITSVLEVRRGPVPFQLPPDFKKDLPRLDAFLRFVDNRMSSPFETRHESGSTPKYSHAFAHIRAHCVSTNGTVR
jgi:uncharacterized protein YecE (DUF72 family)